MPVLVGWGVAVAITAGGCYVQKNYLHPIRERQRIERVHRRNKEKR